MFDTKKSGLNNTKNSIGSNVDVDVVDVQS